MKTLQVTQKAEAQIAEINSLVDSGLASIQRAGEIVVSLLNQGYTAKLIANLSGKFSAKDIFDLERVGNRTMNPYLLTFTSPAVKYLSEAPIEIQAEVIENGVDVMVREGNEIVKKNLKINQLTHATCKTAFNKGKIRSLAAQKKTLANLPEKVRPAPWVIEYGLLKVNSACVFSAGDLKTILKKL